MVDVTPLVARDRQIIQAYAGGVFRVSGVEYRGSVVITPDRVFAWTVTVIEQISQASFHDVSGYEVILIGTGQKTVLLAPELRRRLRENGLKVETMDTGAACRTYNVLMAEGRKVAACLMVG